MFVAPEAGPANDAMAAGRYAEAAVLYAQAAIASHRAGDGVMLRMNAILSVKAYVHAGDAKNAVLFATQTIDVIKASGRPAEIPGFASKALDSLRQHGFAAEADGLSAHVGEVVGGGWSDPQAPRLPAFCSSCGAVVKPAEVVRPTPSTVACRYCGASLAR